MLGWIRERTFSKCRGQCGWRGDCAETRETFEPRGFLPVRSCRSIPVCVVGMETYAASQLWARRLASLGHDVRLIPAQFVKPYVNTNKADAGDVEAICKVVQRPTMRSAPLKTEAQREALVVHRIRQQFLKQRTQSINLLRAHCAEFGVVAPQGRGGYPSYSN